SILTAKAADAGRRVGAAPPAYSSPRRSGPHCGVIALKGVSVRWRACPTCGTDLRDRPAGAACTETATPPGTESGLGKAVGQSRRGGVALAASENRASVGL